MLPTSLAYLLVFGFFVGEGRTRKGEAAQSMKAGSFDQKSTLSLGVAYGVCGLGLLAAPLLNYFGIGVLPGTAILGWVGVVIAAGGIALRLWANQVLGQFYTRTLKVTESQTIVQAGPYGLIRHPGYAGMIVMWVGAGLAVTNWLMALLIMVVMFSVYAYRIQSEEAMMAASYGAQYAEYQHHTRKLIPFLY
jgi:protein-S-isoprenylcysteine O-methyltransferase